MSKDGSEGTAADGARPSLPGAPLRIREANPKGTPPACVIVLRADSRNRGRNEGLPDGGRSASRGTRNATGGRRRTRPRARPRTPRTFPTARTTRTLPCTTLLVARARRRAWASTRALAGMGSSWRDCRRTESRRPTMTTTPPMPTRASKSGPRYAAMGYVREVLVRRQTG